MGGTAASPSAKARVAPRPPRRQRCPGAAPCNNLDVFSRLRKSDHARGGGEAGRPPTRGSARLKPANGDWTSANTSRSARQSAATTRRACAGSPAQPLRRPARRGTGDTPDSTRRVRSPALPGDGIRVNHAPDQPFCGLVHYTSEWKSDRMKN